MPSMSHYGSTTWPRIRAQGIVVLCHGTRCWITDTARKARVVSGALAVSVLERASIEPADVAVTPSRYMLEWMDNQGRRLRRDPSDPVQTALGVSGDSQSMRAMATRAESSGLCSLAASRRAREWGSPSQL